MRRLVTGLALLALVGLPRAIHAEEAAETASDLPEILAGLDGQAIWETCKEFCADDMKGRKTGWKSGDEAEAWVASKMAEMGLHPADSGGTYLEPFTFDTATTKAPITLKVGDKQLEYSKDFFDLIYTGSGKVTGEIVFCGYGIHRPDADWDDYADVDVKGKIVMAIRGAPAVRRTEFMEERYIGYKSSTAADKGAIGFILVEGEKASTGTIQARFYRSAMPSVWATEAVADDVLAAANKRYKKEKSLRDASGPGTSFATGVTASLEVNSEYRKGATGRNILGAIKGRDPDIGKEVILVGAHMDHLGIDPTGQVFNGADDNATGTAVLLHIADQLTLKRWKPKRTVVFVAFAAEEQGLYGAAALAQQLPFEHDGVVCLLNMDMVGQGEPKIRISGVGSYPKIFEKLKGAVPPSMKDKVNFSLRTAPNGDHWPFHNRGIPAFFIATQGKHPNYHTPLDDIERIEPELLEVTAKAVGSWVVALGEHPESLIDKHTMPHFLLREGPRFDVVTAKQAMAVDVDTLLADGVSALIVDVNEADGFETVAKELRAKAKAKDSRFAIAHSASGIQNAYNRAKIAFLLRARAGKTLAADPTAAKALKKLGYKIVAPFLDAPEAAAKKTEILQQVVANKMLVDLTGLDVDGLKAARATLKTWPALLKQHHGPKAAPLATLQAAAGPETLIVCLCGHGVHAVAPVAETGAMLCSPDVNGLCDALLAWCAERPGTWWEPGSADRKEIRALLGGRLVQWLRRAR
ncbi:MAG: M20/M25/M40 family metallo-hydrolase [Planctomycetota bacterium]|nr:M20/M25/M40 family metallo-hydrolase [Planctomycetota bacterium]